MLFFFSPRFFTEWFWEIIKLYEQPPPTVDCFFLQIVGSEYAYSILRIMGSQKTAGHWRSSPGPCEIQSFTLYSRKVPTDS